MRPCPHCGQPIRDEYTHCPFCGTDVATGRRTESVRGGGDDAGVGGALGCTLSGLIYLFCGAGYLEMGNLLSAARQGHLEWGSVAHLLSQRHEYLWLGIGLPLLLTGLPYLLLRRRFPKFARGVGFSCLVTVVCALGAPFLCSNEPG